MSSNLILQKGRYRARLADGTADVERAQRLRHLCFIDGAGLAPRARGLDTDEFDAVSRHILIEDAESGALLGTFRTQSFESGASILRGYSAQYYDLTRLSQRGGRMIEIGRFCLAPGSSDPDILRIAWGALARDVDAGGIELLFGCSSFAGIEPAPHAAAFAYLGHAHQAPTELAPGIKSAATIALQPKNTAVTEALRTMPPLLRSYLTMGGWVSGHAVIDANMNTIHVFTAVEVAAIPETRAKALRAIGA